MILFFFPDYIWQLELRKKTSRECRRSLIWESWLSRAWHKLGPWQSARFIDFDLNERNYGYWQRKRSNARISSPTRSVTIASRSLQIDFNELEEKQLGGPRPRWSCITEDERGSLATTTVMDSVVEKWRFNRCFAHFSSSLMKGCLK